MLSYNKSVDITRQKHRFYHVISTLLQSTDCQYLTTSLPALLRKTADRTKQEKPLVCFWVVGYYSWLWVIGFWFLVDTAFLIEDVKEQR